MTSTVYRGDGSVAGIDLLDTVTLHLPDSPDVTTRDLSTYRTGRPVLRRPDASGEQPIVIPRTIGIVDSPTDTGALPPFVQAAMSQPSRLDRRAHVGRHRAVRPSLAERIRRLLGGAR